METEIKDDTAKNIVIARNALAKKIEDALCEFTSNTGVTVASVGFNVSCPRDVLGNVFLVAYHDTRFDLTV